MLTTDADRDTSTRRRVLRLVVEDGPISVVELARDLDLTAAGVRRHVAALEDAGQIAVFETRHTPSRRGRPARRYVAAAGGHASLSSAYADLATMVLDHVREVAGPDGVRRFAEHRAGEIATRHAEGLAAAGADVADRVDALAAGLAEDGYATSVRPAPGTRAVQLCQGHCPVQAVAARYPELCEAETRMFSEVLGVHVQRLSTIAAGGRVCTTHVPLTGPHDLPLPGTLTSGSSPSDSTTSDSTTSDSTTSDRPAPGTPSVPPRHGAMEGTR